MRIGGQDPLDVIERGLALVGEKSVKGDIGKDRAPVRADDELRFRHGIERSGENVEPGRERVSALSPAKPAAPSAARAIAASAVAWPADPARIWTRHRVARTDAPTTVIGIVRAARRIRPISLTEGSENSRRSTQQADSLGFCPARAVSTLPGIIFAP
jgi:hypothetical protein